ALQGYLPKVESTAKTDTKLLDAFEGKKRTLVNNQVDDVIQNSGDQFELWYQNYRQSINMPPVKNAKKSASANHKAEWVKAEKPQEWQRITSQ
ncbi:vgrG protein, partial [Vibrio anguillarum]|nr:vgrG protein [Vibrio anguillarum]